MSVVPVDDVEPVKSKSIILDTETMDVFPVSNVIAPELSSVSVAPVAATVTSGS